jgi:hypothetical protein
MNARPLHDRIIVRRPDEGEQQIGGIIIPDSAKEKPQQGKKEEVASIELHGTRQQERSQMVLNSMSRSKLVGIWCAAVITFGAAAIAAGVEPTIGNGGWWLTATGDPPADMARPATSHSGRDFTLRGYLATRGQSLKPAQMDDGPLRQPTIHPPATTHRALIARFA